MLPLMHTKGMIRQNFNSFNTCIRTKCLPQCMHMFSLISIHRYIHVSNPSWFLQKFHMMQKRMDTIIRLSCNFFVPMIVHMFEIKQDKIYIRQKLFYIIISYKTIGIYSSMNSRFFKFFKQRQQCSGLQKRFSSRYRKSSFSTKIGFHSHDLSKNRVYRQRSTSRKRNSIWIVTIQTLKNTTLQKQNKSYSRSFMCS